MTAPEVVPFAVWLVVLSTVELTGVVVVVITVTGGVEVVGVVVATVVVTIVTFDEL